MRREMDRLAGEILRRHEDEPDECLVLMARRESLRAISHARRSVVRDTRALYRWART